LTTIKRDLVKYKKIADEGNEDGDMKRSARFSIAAI
jgi:hypothetical protein